MVSVRRGVNGDTKMEGRYRHQRHPAVNHNRVRPEGEPMRGQPPTKVFLGAFPVEACSTAGLHRWSISHYPTPNVTLAGDIESHLAHSGAVSCVEHEAEREAIKATGEVRAACWAQARPTADHVF